MLNATAHDRARCAKRRNNPSDDNRNGFASLVVGAEVLVSRPVLAAALLAAAAISLAALIRREMPRAAPLIPLNLLRAASFRISVMASVCCLAGVTMGLLALPFYLQHSLGQDTLMTGST